MLSRLIIDQFDDMTYQRGVECFRDDCVEITQFDDDKIGSINATVRGQTLYEVSIFWSSRECRWDCFCPFFEQNDYCKHVVATLLEADEQRLLPARLLAPTDAKNTKPAAAVKMPAPPQWIKHLDKLHQDAQSGVAARDNYSSGKAPPAGSQIIYVLQPPSWSGNPPSIRLMRRSPKPDGTFDRPKKLELNINRLCEMPEADRSILASIVGLGSTVYGYGYGSRLLETYPLNKSVTSHLLPEISRTGRLYWSDATTQPTQNELCPILWQDQPFDVELELSNKVDAVVLRCFMVQGDRRWESHNDVIRTVGHLVLIDGAVGTFRDLPAAWWFTHFQQLPEISCPPGDLWKLVKQLATMRAIPPLRVSGEFPATVQCPEPSVSVRLEPVQTFSNTNRLTATTHFGYENYAIPAGLPCAFIADEPSKRILLRNGPAETAAIEFMELLGFKNDKYVDNLVIPEKKALPAIVAMMQRGWTVEAEKIGRYRPAGKFNIALSSNIDWFDVRGEAHFDDQVIALPKLLEAIAKGERFVKLGDGSMGVLPEQWFKQIGMLATAGRVEGDVLRFKPSQAAILDLLLQQIPEANCDAQFQAVREQLHRFEGIQPVEPPTSFVGTLREYQKEGLGWFEFLRQFQFGGCLADDMGLGKTVQVLALLEQRRLNKQGAPRASLVVAPRSLVFNWMQEAARFSPQLKVLDHSGAGRAAWTQQIANFDLILTTYGTLRADAAKLKDVVFDYVILDESQAIKNATTVTAKAVRLLQGGHRLALSGTPIENHVGELWSLFEFLNPGMLGKASVFAGLATSTEVSADTARFLGKALRPFILRRTKKQVAKELPDRTEQTIYCELEGEHKAHYIQLRDHYRQALLGGAGNEGFEKNGIQVLEALLRLRQAACHPGLLDEKRTDESSPKLDVILDQIQSVTEEGHKVLVFSQFTSFLAIVRKQLDKLGIVYEYLDGQTRNRQEHVERFQNDPACKLFLISLKAGGVGLNLTAADYVFILDPWWNPAVEAQAIDRAHRIGQHRQVFAYRLIAKDTVEEKVLELQARKRELADAIINASSGPLASLTRQDLELLLQ